MKKSGERYDAVINHIKTTNVPEVVERFGKLRVSLVEHELQELSASYQINLCNVFPTMPSDLIAPFATMLDNDSTIGNVDPMYDIMTDGIYWTFAAEGGFMQSH